MSFTASIVIPAHNEAYVILRCLRSILGSGTNEGFEVIVVCNGCTDETAELVRRFHPEVIVIELDEASKSAALNAGDARATSFPRFYVDADVEIDPDAIRHVVRVLTGGEVMCAAPAPQFETSAGSWAIRSFYRVWTQLPYLNDDMVGSGVYALSEEGRSRFGRFPGITADDQYVMQLFAPGDRRSCQEVSFRVHAPTRVRGLYNIRSRAYRGNRELNRSGLAATEATGGAWSGLLELARHPRNWPALAVYVVVNSAARIRLYRAVSWERDESARAAANSA
jgi:glycosyltransferase involved in cell wall biosynthesis